MPKRAATDQQRKRTSPATKQIAQWIREGIRIGRIVPGQRLVEADIVAETGASRVKVREALQRLESEGLVDIEAFRGASVKRLTIDEIRQIYRVRMALEGLAASEFATTASQAQKQKLHDIQTQMDALVESGRHDQFASLNAAWHQLIIDGADNVVIKQFLSRLTIPIYRLLFSTFYGKQRIHSAIADHRAITYAICEGDADTAERAMRQHIMSGFAAICELDSQLLR